MVNILKRMRKLKPQLLSLHSGPGAALLPQNLPPTHPSHTSQPPHQPSLQSLHLTYPPGVGPASLGARNLWRNHLRRLKYHNPGLPITVNQMASSEEKWQVALTFRGAADSLRQLAAKRSGATEDEAAAAAEEEEEAQDESAGPIETEPPTNIQNTQAQAQTQTQTHTRTLTLPTHNRTAATLWKWIQTHTNAIDVPETETDRAEKQALADHEVQAAVIRGALRVELERKRAKEDALRAAKEEANRGEAEAGEMDGKGGKGGKGKTTRGAGGRVRYSAAL